MTLLANGDHGPHNGTQHPQSDNASHSSPRDIWIVTGPAGCGKSTVAQFLANHFKYPMVEGDDFHPPSNVDKMKAGVPLHDADRWDWLVRLRQHCTAQLQAQPQPQPHTLGVVLACSALKRKYRDVIRIAAYYDHRIRIHFVYLRASVDLLAQRVKARQGHYMKDNMVQSQFQELEEPAPDELDCLVVDVSGTVDHVDQLALQAVQAVLQNRQGTARVPDVP